MATKARKPKPPKIPRCLCGSFLHWVLQIPSPSKVYMAMLRPTVESEKYFYDRHRWRMAVLQRKVEARTCTRKEWDELRQLRFIERRRPYGG